MAAISLTLNLPAWATMWMVAFGVFAGCKLWTWQPVKGRMSGRRSAAYLCGWPGLDPGPFMIRTRSGRSVPRASEWISALGKTLLGVGLIRGGVRFIAAGWPGAAAWVGIVGVGFLLHFGTFHVLALIWRTAGHDVRRLMDAPHRATSLADFWGRRWNLAFRDMSHRLIFAPLRGRLGSGGAVMVVFLFSGVVHDLVISLPAGGGYGLPTSYFLLQGVGLMAQRTCAGRRLRVDRGICGWMMTAATVVGPLPLLFHEPFQMRIVLPFLAAIGAL